MLLSIHMAYKNTLSFGQRLKTARHLLLLSQQQAADMCGVRREMWGKYERDEAEPGAYVLERFSAHGADPSYLLKGVLKNSTDAPDGLGMLEHIAIQLEIPTRAMELESIYEQFQAEKEAWLASGMNEDKTDKSRAELRAWLEKSPFVILNWWALRDVIDKLEFALDMKGETMSTAHKADAIVDLYRKAKRLPEGQRLGIDAYKAAIDLWGTPKPQSEG